jgi:hypothetical protein
MRENDEKVQWINENMRRLQSKKEELEQQLRDQKKVFEDELNNKKQLQEVELENRRKELEQLYQQRQQQAEVAMKNQVLQFAQQFLVQEREKIRAEFENKPTTSTIPIQPITPAPKSKAVVPPAVKDSEKEFEERHKKALRWKKDDVNVDSGVDEVAAQRQAEEERRQLDQEKYQKALEAARYAHLVTHFEPHDF